MDILDEVDGAGQPGFDHCLVIDRPDDAAPGALVQCAVVKCDGITMRVATTQPGVQLYTVRSDSLVHATRLNTFGTGSLAV